MLFTPLASSAVCRQHSAMHQQTCVRPCWCNRIHWFSIGVDRPIWGSGDEIQVLCEGFSDRCKVLVQYRHQWACVRLQWRNTSALWSYWWSLVSSTALCRVSSISCDIGEVCEAKRSTVSWWTTFGIYFSYSWSFVFILCLSSSIFQWSLKVIVLLFLLHNFLTLQIWMLR